MQAVLLFSEQGVSLQGQWDYGKFDEIREKWSDEKNTER